MRVFTIQDLADGKCSVINDGTLQELRKVLKLAFPKDPGIAGGNAQYYFASTKDVWVGNDFKNNLPAQSVRNFLVDDFVLPEKWCIEINSNTIDTINEYRKTLDPKNNFTEPLLLGTWQFYGRFNTIGPVMASAVSNDLTHITLEQFKKHVLKETNMSKDKRFPFYLNPDDAQKIVDIACKEWKAKLAAMWANHIVLSKQLEITETFYKEMRKACTSEQHKLFDTIFGKDTVVDLSILNNTDIFYVTCTSGFSYLFKGNPFSLGVTGWNYKSNRLLTSDIPLCAKENILDLRKATSEEIRFYNEKCNPYKDGDLVWVKTSHISPEWRLRYTTGVIKDNKLQCYEEQRKNGPIAYWHIYKPAPGITLPE